MQGADRNKRTDTCDCAAHYSVCPENGFPRDASKTSGENEGKDTGYWLRAVLNAFDNRNPCPHEFAQKEKRHYGASRSILLKRYLDL